ncbi:MAG: helix-turn-helix domain-containing protein [Acidimicrobiia bacterium]|nr:helix-turn-helix domain-containing protein [Acidimicrobiia bacterium]
MERRIAAMRDDGLSIGEIAQRVGRSLAQVERILQWISIPRSGPPSKRSPRPIELRVLALRAAGETHAEVGSRFRRSAGFIRQVEGLAHFRLGFQLLGFQSTDREMTG